MSAQPSCTAGQVVDTVGDTTRPFRLASVTKPLVAWSILVAVEEGTLTLDDPAGQPGCTIRHLLSHAGGYAFDGATPIGPPERARVYSNTGIEVAAERARRIERDSNGATTSRKPCSNHSAWTTPRCTVLRPTA